MDYICSVCGKPATHYKKITINGKANVTYYCSDCQNDLESVGSVANVVSNIFTGNNRTVPSRVRTCKCGLTDRDILDEGKFGCAECYVTFRDIADNYIASRGFGMHKGKAPIRYAASTGGVGQNKNSNQNNSKTASTQDGSGSNFNNRVNIVNKATSSRDNDIKTSAIMANIDILKSEFDKAIIEERYLNADMISKQIIALEKQL